MECLVVRVDKGVLARFCPGPEASRNAEKTWCSYTLQAAAPSRPTHTQSKKCVSCSPPKPTISKRALLTGTIGNSLQAALSPEDLLQFLYYIHSIIGNASKIVEEKTFS